jgi:thymidylate synthase
MTSLKTHDEEYIKLVENILDNGIVKGDRTGTGTISLPFQQMRFDLSENSIPLLTTKKMHTRSIIYEILWYLRGDTNIKYLNDNGVTIWDEWADENGDLGPVYGAQWRNWPYVSGCRIDYETDPPTTTINFDGIDQIAEVIHTLRNNPDDRRIIVNAWNVGELHKMALPPCHAMFQFWSAPIEGSDKRQLRCHLYQRSCDVGLGVPFNIVQYSILTHMIAKVTNHVATEFVWTGGDVHIYSNHVEQLEEQIKRTYFPSPRIVFERDIQEIDDFTYEDFVIEGYDCHPTIKMPVAV